MCGIRSTPKREKSYIRFPFLCPFLKKNLRPLSINVDLQKRKEHNHSLSSRLQNTAILKKKRRYPLISPARRKESSSLYEPKIYYLLDNLHFKLDLQHWPLSAIIYQACRFRFLQRQMKYACKAVSLYPTTPSMH